MALRKLPPQGEKIIGCFRSWRLGSCCLKKGKNTGRFRKRRVGNCRLKRWKFTACCRIWRL